MCSPTAEGFILSSLYDGWRIVPYKCPRVRTLENALSTLSSILSTLRRSYVFPVDPDFTVNMKLLLFQRFQYIFYECKHTGVN